MISYKQGNLLADRAAVLVNTVNTVGIMGKGIALQFRQAYPHNFAVYAAACRRGEVCIGKILAVTDRDLLSGTKTILNLPTKTHWRLPSSYSYVDRGLAALRQYMLDNNVKTVAMPAPGCGNGGLDWERVKPMLIRYLADLDCAITVYLPTGDLHLAKC